MPAPSGTVLIEELYLEADVVVRVVVVTTVVVTTTEVTYSPPPRTIWCTVLDFRFRAIEYLKGSGPSEINADAEPCGSAEGVSSHDTQWDDREAIVFLEQRPSGSWYYFMGFLGARPRII